MQRHSFVSPQLDELPDVCVHDEIRKVLAAESYAPTTSDNLKVLFPTPKRLRYNLFRNQHSVPGDLLLMIRVLKISKHLTLTSEWLQAKSTNLGLVVASFFACVSPQPTTVRPSE